MPALAHPVRFDAPPPAEPPLSPPVSPVLASPPALTVAPEPGAAPASPRAPKRDQRRIVLRLRDGESVQVGVAPDPDRAFALARALVAKLETLEGDWPRVGDRFIRPDAIVSVDVLHFA